jgi:hypothetical protein
MAHAADYLRARAPKLHSRALVALVFVLPYCRIQDLVAAGIAKRQTASVYLKALTELGVLREVKVGREKLFLHPRFLDLPMSDDHRFTPYTARGPARAVARHRAAPRSQSRARRCAPCPRRIARTAETMRQKTTVR